MTKTNILYSHSLHYMKKHQVYQVIQKPVEHFSLNQLSPMRKIIEKIR
jgi:hypothetical protein